MRFEGTHTLVTGASHGIGIHIARQARRRGARVTVLGRDKERVCAVAEELDATPLVADLADPTRLDQVIPDAEAVNGPVEVLINNAGLALVGAVDRALAGQARMMMDVNAVAPMELCRQVLPGMLARGRGQIVNVSSLVGVSAVPDLALYGASKAALHHFTSILQRDLSGSPVRATLVTLGEVAGTHLMENARQSARIDAVSKRLARLMPVQTPEVVASGIADAVEREAMVVTIPRRLGAIVTLRNLPGTLQDLAFIGIPR
jgi:short-subunit dehydrogenase